MQDFDIKLTVDEINNVVEVEETPDDKKNRFYGKMPLVGKASYLLFLFTILLVPLFVPPSSWGLQLEFAKKILFSGGVLLSFILWLITRLEDGRIVFPGGAIFWSGLSLVMSFLISSLLSSSIGSSLLGLGYENDTFVSIAIFFLSMFLASTFFESRKKLSQFFFGLTTLSLVIGIMAFIQIFSPTKFLSGGVLANFIGKWNDFGIFFGLSMLLSLIALDFRSLYNGKLRHTLWFLLIMSSLLVMAVNYSLIWATVGVFSLAILIYSLVNGESKGIKNIIFRPSFIVLLLSIICFFGSNSIGSVLGKYGIFQLEVRPSWQSTVEVAKSSMQSNLFFGSGPNSFGARWSSSKPDAVNSTVFWNTEFNVGFGRIPSFSVTLGLLGLITSGLFLVSLLYHGIRALLSSFDDTSDHPEILLSSIASLYLWCFSVFYVTDTVILVLTFVFTGIFLASLVRAGLLKNYEFSFLDNPKLGFLSVLIIVLLIISVISGGYLLYRKSAAVYGFQNSLFNFNNSGNLQQAETSIKNVINLDQQDLYYRSLTEIYLINLRNLINNPSNLPKESLLSQLQLNLSLAAGSARKATEINGSNYLNWVTLGKVGEIVAPLKNVVAGSYELAFNSYSKALSLNSKDPNVYLSLAKLEAGKGDIVKAKDYIGQALVRKSNFTAGLFLLSQIEASQGNLTGAITKAEEALVFSPGDIGVLFQIGFLKYMNKNYSGAIDSLKKATEVQPNYSNAKYFLGLSYSKLGRIPAAIKEFQEISALNSDNLEVKNILRNLRAGRGALEDIVPPKNEPKEPEKRSKPPVRE